MRPTSRSRASWPTSCGCSPPPRRRPRRGLHGGHARAHRHHAADLRRPLRRRQRRHRRRGPQRPIGIDGDFGDQPGARRRSRWCATVGAVDGVPSAVGESRATPSSSASDGKAVEGDGSAPPTLGANWIDDPTLNPLRARRRAARPQAADEVVDRHGAPPTTGGSPSATAIDACSPSRPAPRSTVVGIAPSATPTARRGRRSPPSTCDGAERRLSAGRQRRRASSWPRRRRRVARSELVSRIDAGAARPASRPSPVTRSPPTSRPTASARA